MESTKDWYKSKTVWSALVITIIGSLGLAGFGRLEGEQETITEFIMQLVTIVAGIIALIGRVRAKAKIKPPAGTLLLFLLIIPVMIIFPGCSNVRMSPEYAQLTAQSAIIVAELERRCIDANDIEACRAGLSEAAKTLDLIVDALHGVDSAKGGDL